MRINVQRVTDLAERGVPAAEIARIEGVAQSTIWRALKKYSVERQTLDEFRTGKADLLDEMQRRGMEFVARVLESIEDEDIRAMTASQKMDAVRTGVIMSGTYYDKGRLERGQSTANIQSLIVQAARRADELDEV